MKKIKRILSMLTIVAIIAAINMCAFVSFAASDAFQITIGNVKAKPGERVEVPVSIKNVPSLGVANIDFTFGYDSDLFKVIELKPGSIVENPSKSFDYNIVEDDEIVAIIFAEDSGRGTEAIKQDGVLFTIVMEVNKDAKPGTVPIKFTSFGSAADNNLEDLNTERIDGQLEIIQESAPVPTSAPSSGDSGTGSSGGTQPSTTPKVTEQPTTTPKTTEQPIEEIPHGGSTSSRHTPFLRGYPGGLFKPENNITRAEAAVIFAKLLGADENSAGKNSSVTFKDLKDNHWAAWAIKYVTEEELFGGYPDGTFMPDKSITRAEFATVTYKFLQKLGKIEEGSNAGIQLKDIQGHWAQKYIETLVAKGYIKGYPDETFRPQASIKRSESVALINRSLERGPLNGAVLEFTDVPQNYWAYKDIAEGVIYHSYIIDENGQEVMVEKLD
ncbi:MAG TPA: S-layer homology domain-containing protein [Acetivibrio sp.]|uniref:cohesin domain-containing protein n=1 Tax=Acetivibrio sp. TaxID=1872092 RepID=UPI002C77A5E8|nr:cohesin domain-containing protein [Acetivibrio sp.]HOM03701.1 S-layer homology domain-containing protein [Acetivibrio sp.]